MSIRSSNPTLGDDPLAQRNRESITRVALMVGFALLMAAAAPSALGVAAFSSLLLIGALIASGFALFSSEPPSAPHFTRWDEAAALLGMSIFAGFFVDPVAVQSAVTELQAAQ
jgi:hypothetical protein